MYFCLKCNNYPVIGLINTQIFTSQWRNLLVLWKLSDVHRVCVLNPAIIWAGGTPFYLCLCAVSCAVSCAFTLLETLKPPEEVRLPPVAGCRYSIVCRGGCQGWERKERGGDILSNVSAVDEGHPKNGISLCQKQSQAYTAHRSWSVYKSMQCLHC